jgi:cullin 3
VDETWSRLSANIREIHNQNTSSLSFEENYRYAYNMVLYKNGAVLYKGVCQLVAENIDRLAQREIIPAFPSGSSKDPVQRSQEGELLLRAVRRVWDDHTGNMSKLRDILKYMVSTPSWYIFVTHGNILRIASIRRLMMFQKYGMLAWISS